jgi:monoamine oxidase
MVESLSGALPLLTGWAAGPNAEKIKDLTDSEIIDLALTSLSNLFKVNRHTLKKKLIAAKVANWLTDTFALGAYSYATVESKKAAQELIKPVANRIFLAGEALYRGQETATVEGALANGKETAEYIMKL